MYLKGNNLYIGCDENLVLCFNTDQKVVVKHLNYYEKYHIKGPTDKIYIDEENRFWICVSNKGIVITDSNFNMIKIVSFYSLTNNIVFNDYTVRKDNLIVATSKGAFQVSLYKLAIEPNDPVTVYLINLTKGQDIHAIYYNDYSVLIASTKGLNLVDVSGLSSRKVVVSKNYDDKEWISLTKSIYRKGNTVWLGTQYGVGLIRNMNSPFSSFFSSLDGSYTKIQHSITLHPANDSSILVCSDNGLYLANYNNGKIESLAKGDIFYAASKGPRNTILASSITNGFLVLKDKHQFKAQGVFPELEPLQKDLFISIANLADSIYFLASQNKNGLYIWNVPAKTLRVINSRSEPTLKSDVINRLYLNSRNDLWIICDNTVSIYHLNEDKVKNLHLIDPTSKKELSIIMDVCEINGRYWLAVYGVGIVELSKDLNVKRIYSSKEGLNNVGLYKIYPFTDTSIITSSNNGISVLNIKTGKFRNYFEEVGLQSSSFEEASGCITKDYIFLGGVNGFTKIDPKKFTINNVPPNLYFTNIEIRAGENKFTNSENISDLNIKYFKIRNTWLQTNISFVGLNYSDPERVVYQYKIREQGIHWIPIGHQNFVSLIGLDPGTYTLEVKAANEDGYWSPVKQLILTFEPKWYQTWSFKILIVLVIATILYAFFRYRINQIRKQHQIRKDIASDLHDDIGSSLNTVKIFTHLAKKESDKEPYLNEIETSLTSATTGLRDMLWVLDDSQDTAFELVERIRKFVLPVLQASNIRLDARVEADEHKALSKAEKKNLYLIAKESINNSIKYADCKNISLHIHQANGKTAVLIQDDGKGFDTSKQPEGNGLKNIRERARQIHYLVDITSSPEKGTAIKLMKK